jgi:predicted amidohydrolase
LKNGLYRVATVQFALRPLSRFEDFADQATGTVVTAKGEFDARCVVLPEYCTGGLLSIPTGDGKPATMHDYASYAPRYVELFKGLARTHDIAILAGTQIVAEGNKLYNAAHLFHPDGRIDVQKKLHMTPSEESPWGLSAGEALKLVELPFGKAAMLTCYDTEFPELARQARARGAKVIFTPSCTDDRHGFHRVRYTAHARAIEDQVFVVTAHTVGGLPSVDNLRSNVGRAAILTPCDYPFPQGGVLAEGEMNLEMVIAADLDMAALERAQGGGSVRTWQHRRGGDLYPDIA